MVKFKKPTNWYKDLVIRPVIPVDGFVKHERVVEKIADIYYNFKDREAEIIQTVKYNPLDKDAAPVTILTGLKIGQAKCPTYFVNKNLLDALIKSDTSFSVEPELINWAMESAIFMIPLDTIYFSLENSKKHRGIYCIFWHIDKNNNTLYWVATTGLDYFCRRFPLGAKQIYNSCSENYDSKTVEEFNELINSILLKLLLVMQSRPEFVDEATNEIATEVRFNKKGFSKENKIDLYQPLWIGKDYVLKQSKLNNEKNKGTHASPRMHWRRGHFRNQKVGKERKESKLIWIEPVLVMA